MPVPLRGLHHVTATVDRAQPDLDFCVALLGLRLVKQTVNFDNRRVFHFYYGDERGSPGSIWTTFPYHGHGVRPGVHGAGQVTATAFSVPVAALPAWGERLQRAGAGVSERATRFGEPALVVSDPSGLIVHLVASDADARIPWAGGAVPASEAIRGLHSVTLQVREEAPTVAFLVEVLGGTVAAEDEGCVRLSVGDGCPGAWLDVRQDSSSPIAVNGTGTVHHVALAINDHAAQRQLRDDLIRRGVTVTDVLDRQYFQSIYFREPGGVLIEVATVEPGFTTDEPLDRLGLTLQLPPWEEPRRAEIEAGLPAIVRR
ncbi:MAG: ring-cleaving dioxygenase [Acidobacteria bacterium]|nr:ring-cleaving dioxygenase [Acidobacteriota bacterium]